MKKTRKTLLGLGLILFCYILSGCPANDRVATQTASMDSEEVTVSATNPMLSSTPTAPPTPTPDPWPPQVLEDDSLSGLYNGKNPFSKDDAGFFSIIEDGSYLYFVAEVNVDDSGISAHNICRCDRDGSNLIVLGNAEMYADQIEKPEGANDAYPCRINYIADERMFVEFRIDTSDSSSYLLYSLDLNGGDLKHENFLNENISLPIITTNYVIDGEWIYYSAPYLDKIYRCKLDGSDEEVIYNEYAYALQIRDGWLFYITATDINTASQIGTISCINLSNRTKTDIYKYANKNIYGINLCGNWIYFSDAADGHLYKIKTNGTELTAVSDKVISIFWIYGHTVIYEQYFFSKAGSIYTALGFPLCRIDVDGENVSEIYESSMPSFDF